MSGFDRVPPGGFFYFLTLTAPGDHQHRIGENGPWCKCTLPGGTDISAWNGDHSRVYNLFMTRLRQRTGLTGQDLIFSRGVEVQDGKRLVDGDGRGALHDHVIVWSLKSLPAIPDLRRLAIDAGYGHELRCDPLGQAEALRLAAVYTAKRVSGYVAKASDDRDAVPWRRDVVDTRTGEITEQTKPTYRTWSKSNAWGLTMKAVRAENLALARRLDATRQATPLEVQVATPGPSRTVVTDADPPSAP